jgi:hypothetical protein
MGLKEKRQSTFTLTHWQLLDPDMAFTLNECILWTQFAFTLTIYGNMARPLRHFYSFCYEKTANVDLIEIKTSIMHEE